MYSRAQKLDLTCHLLTNCCWVGFFSKFIEACMHIAYQPWINNTRLRSSWIHVFCRNYNGSAIIAQKQDFHEIIQKIFTVRKLTIAQKTAFRIIIFSSICNWNGLEKMRIHPGKSAKIKGRCQIENWEESWWKISPPPALFRVKGRLLYCCQLHYNR